MLPVPVWTNYVRDKNSSFIVPLQSKAYALSNWWCYNATNLLLTSSQGNLSDFYLPQEVPTIAGAADWVWTNILFVASNSMACVIVDTSANRILDIVNLSGLVTANTLGNLGNNVTAEFNIYKSYYFTNSNAGYYGTNSISAGVSNQVMACLHPDLAKGSGDPERVKRDQSEKLTNWWFQSDNSAVISSWYVPVVSFGFTSYQANDPLVHYTMDDLIDPNNSVTKSPTLGALNTRYAPWGKTNTVPDLTMNMVFKDPNVAASDDWNFPTGRFASVGWLGRVHRGTPWQTIYLKADPIANSGENQTWWLNNWMGQQPWNNLIDYGTTNYTRVGADSRIRLNPQYRFGTLDNYPTTDWALVDLFTVAPNDNASRGTLSVNQTNVAPWAAVFAGVPILTNKNGSGTWVLPGDVSTLFYGYNNYAGIHTVRTNYLNEQYGYTFHRVGEILAAESLTTASPFVGNPATDRGITDNVVEAIPQRVLSLLRVGEPRFVIWSYGQSLKPAGYYLGTGGNFLLTTNYSITGESLTRTVCRVERDTNNIPRIVVESFNTVNGTGE
jgi:hypothetical protein